MESREYVAKQAKLDKLRRDKDQYLAEFRKQALELQSELEQYLAEEKIKAKVEAMSPAEKQAMAVELGKGS